VETRRTRIPLPLPVASVAKEQRLFDFLSSRRLSERGGKKGRGKEGRERERERKRERPFSSCLVPLGEKKARDKGLIESKGETGERRERGRREREEGEEREKATNGYFES
jgi:hypothetical protein